MGRTPESARLYHKQLLYTVVSICLAAFYAQGCGASFQALYEAEARFEHCYRLDEEPSIAPEHRLACWREWSTYYTYGQTRDRLEYALRRERELTSQLESPKANEADKTDTTAPSE